MKKFSLLSLLFFFTLSFSQEIDVITQEKIGGIITILSYSPDGSLIASGSAKENSIKVWDVNSGKIIGKLEGHDGATTALNFSADGKKLVSSAMDDYLILWDVVNWKMLDSVKVEKPKTWMVNDKKDANIFFLASRDGTVEQRSLTNFKEKQTLFTDNSPILKIDVSVKHLAAGTNTGEIIIYDLPGNEMVRQQKVHGTAVKGLKFHNNGEGLITTGGGGVVHLWNINNLRDSKHINASSSLITAFDANEERNRFVIATNTRRIHVFDFEGNEIFEFKDKLEDHKNSETIRAIQISPDGSTVASSGFNKAKNFRIGKGDNVIRIWDMNRGTLYKLLEGQVNPILTFDFHPQENALVTLGKERILTFWDFDVAEKYGEFRLEETKREVPPKRKFWSKENIGKKTDKILDNLKNGRLGNIGSGIGRNIGKPERGKEITSGLLKRTFTERPIVKFSAKGNYLFTKLPKDEIRYYEIKNRKPAYVGPLWSYQLNINTMICSPDEKYLAVLGSGDSAVSIINLETKQCEGKLLTPGPKGKLNFVYEANSAAFSPDSSLFAVCFNNSKTFVYDTKNWKLQYETVLIGDVGLAHGAFVNFSEDGKTMVVSSTFGIKKYNTSRFDILSSEELPISGRSAPLDKPSNFAITHKDDNFYLQDIFANTYKKSIRANPKDITHISVSPAGKFGITTKSGQFILINPATAEEEILLVADGDNFIFKTSKNYYKVSKEGYDLVTFRIGNRAFPFEQFDAVFNRPDLVLKKLGCKDDTLMSLYKKAYEKRIQKLGLKETTTVSLADIPTLKISNATEIPAFTKKTDIEVNLSMADKSGLNSYNVFINNVPLYGKKGKALAGQKTHDLTQKLSLIHGINKIQITCRSASGYESLMQTFYVEKTGEAPERNLYLVTIGTSKYKDDRYNLTYAAKDGQDLSALMKENTDEIYANIYSKSLYNEDVTAANVIAMNDFLNKSGPDDIVMVFVAGHGVLDANFNYYFGTHDMDFNKPSEKGLAYDKLEGILDGIKANKKILIMDTCHSGEIDKDDVFVLEEDDTSGGEDEDMMFRSVGPELGEDSRATPSRVSSELFNDLRRGTGSTVISSAGGAEFAMESDKWKNGLFTYCLLLGLKNGNADMNKDGAIMLLELQAYVVAKVTVLSHGKQVPNTRIKNMELDFRLW
jgi:WD40 repeat protein